MEPSSYITVVPGGGGGGGGVTCLSHIVARVREPVCEQCEFWISHRFVILHLKRSLTAIWFSDSSALLMWGGVGRASYKELCK